MTEQLNELKLQFEREQVELEQIMPQLQSQYPEISAIQHYVHNMLQGLVEALQSQDNLSIQRFQESIKPIEVKVNCILDNIWNQNPKAAQQVERWSHVQLTKAFLSCNLPDNICSVTQNITETLVLEQWQSYNQILSHQETALALANQFIAKHNLSSKITTPKLYMLNENQERVPLTLTAEENLADFRQRLVNSFSTLLHSHMLLNQSSRTDVPSQAMALNAKRIKAQDSIAQLLETRTELTVQATIREIQSMLPEAYKSKVRASSIG